MLDIDGYCTLVKVLKKSSDYRNVYKILFHSVEIEKYMEKHNIYEIVEQLLIRIVTKQPEKSQIFDFLIENLLEISRRLCKKKIAIEFNNCTADSLKTLKKISKRLQIPLILENSPYNYHQSVVCDFNDDPNEEFMKISTANYPKSPDKNLQLKKAIDIEFHRNNLEHVIQNIRLTYPFRHTRGKWNCRALVVGRLGSGRNTQARLLAKEFGLIFINFQQQLSTTHDLDCLGSLQEILLKPHCLHNGYVVVSNVICKRDLEVVMERFIYRPNLIVFIHTSEMKCRQRILKENSELPFPFTAEEIDYQMKIYRTHKNEFLTYFTCRPYLHDKIYHVNGNESVKDVKSCIWARIFYK